MKWTAQKLFIPSCIERLDVAKNLYTDDSLLKAESKPQSRASNTCTNTTGTKNKTKQNNFIDKDSLFIMIGNLSTEGVEQRARSLKMKVVVESARGGRAVDVAALVDSGAMSTFVSQEFVNSIPDCEQYELERVIIARNSDGTENVNGSITHVVDLIMKKGQHREKITAYVAGIKDKMILGHDWLQRHNPEIDWKKGLVTMSQCPESCGFSFKGKKWLPDDLEEGDKIYSVEIGEPEYIQAYQTTSSQLAQAANANKQSAKIPNYLESYASVFNEKNFDVLLERRHWDHAIELIPGAEPFHAKVYPMSRDKQIQLDESIDESLRTGRICPSKSPWGAPVFFVKKKDGKLRLVQDYRKLNEMTIKNRYPLPLISDLIHKLKNAQFYTKLDIRWGYNNVRMREGDEPLAAFKTY